ncbi:MAG: UvrD-helicase domain-containing protein [Rhodocyclales bacterium]|nr:UvrD-helicase domain-containing protein [Rhodocyclales bacterium]
MSRTTEGIGMNFAAALDPARSAVVEACAGSGKTWLLASRIVRLLLAGTQPAEILAITFTRKAASEIEERVVDWLRLLATAPDDEARQFLRERGAGNDPDTLRRARGLYERVTGAQPGLAVNTFHGWFLQLVAVAPLSANLAGTTLADDGERRFEELWQSFARRLQRDPASAAAAAFVRLLASIGLASTRTLLARGMARRAEWLAHVGDAVEPVAAVVAELGELFGVGAAGGEGAALAAFFAAGWEGEFQAYLGFLEASELDSDRRFGAQLAAALAAEGDAPGARFSAVAGVFLTGTGTLRARKPSKALDKRFGADGAQRFLDLHAALGARLLACLAQQQEERNLVFNRDALTVHQAFVAHLDAFKAERRQIDFVDAEWRVLQLLNDEASAAFVQARLDARYRHVLLDEFQDTNPLQWQILQAWLAAYSDAARPSVFLVGDPKQSIYRFRRAEPRLFAAAADFLGERFAAVRLMQDATRRNAPAIIDVVNALFGAEPGFQPFRPQQSLAIGLPGRVELLPLCAGDDEEAAAVAADPDGTVLRDPLREAAAEVVDSRRQREAAQLAERLGGMLGRTLVRERQGVRTIERPLRYGDVLLLVRTRARIRPVEKALAAAGIPFVAASRGGLLDALEVKDVVALLEFLVTPAADLKLAHALKSPIFACTDDDLLRLAARPEAGWRARLAVLAAAEGGDDAADERLRRAARLVDGWLAAAARLPAHDLLDRIYDEGEVLARYRIAVPEARRGAALANLEALLLLALDLDGGRYPSLPRFIDELRALARVAGDDAPDEGELAADERVAADGRVRIMTIHGAKGLEAPLVWLLDANATAPADKAWDVLVEWAPEAARPGHFSFVGRKEERGVSRQALFDAEAAAAAREELNLLYVAITRAQQLFVASGVANERKGGALTAYDRLQAALARLEAEHAYGDALPEADATASPALPEAPAAGVMPAIPAVGERREVPDAAARFGILLHAMLERRTEDRAAAGWWRELGYSDGEAGRAGVVAERLLATPSLRRFFDPACHLRAWNEMEITAADGSVGRMDRLVEDAEAFWVLDYKSSGPDTPRLEEYREQVAGYCRAVASIFSGKPVRGALIFADASVLEVSA